jgi:hypothetical protein
VLALPDCAGIAAEISAPGGGVTSPDKANEQAVNNEHKINKKTNRIDFIKIV